jgi:hypothetical protein
VAVVVVHSQRLKPVTVELEAAVNQAQLAVLGLLVARILAVAAVHIMLARLRTMVVQESLS